MGGGSPQPKLSKESEVGMIAILDIWQDFKHLLKSSLQLGNGGENLTYFISIKVETHSVGVGRGTEREKEIE